GQVRRQQHIRKGWRRFFAYARFRDSRCDGFCSCFYFLRFSCREGGCGRLKGRLDAHESVLLLDGKVGRRAGGGVSRHVRKRSTSCGRPRGPWAEKGRERDTTEEGRCGKGGEERGGDVERGEEAEKEGDGLVGDVVDAGTSAPGSSGALPCRIDRVFSNVNTIQEKAEHQHQKFTPKMGLSHDFCDWWCTSHLVGQN